MTRRLHFKPGLQEQIRANQKAVDHWAALAGKQTLDLGAKPKRERAAVDVSKSEAPVLKAVGQLLAVHPKVAIALRINSGMAYAEGDTPVWFYLLVRGYGTVSDYFGILTDARPFAVECKRSDWRGVSRGRGKTAIREQKQEQFILHIIRCGGVAGFARSVDEAKAILEGK